tara:strand:+ start:49 stop:735 length:687 start_codon:yes stop_codon:yes gene_type:complete
MKTKIIGEIGINHFGKREILKQYIKNFNNKGLDGLSIQILKKNKVNKKLEKFCLKKKDIEFFLTEARKYYKSVGVAIHTWDDFKFLSKQNIDFIKVLSSSFGNIEYIKKIKKLKLKKIFLSTGGKSMKEISKVTSKLNKKKIGLIYTFFNTMNFNNSIKNISIMKKRIKIPVSYGNHFNKIDEIVKVKKHNPSEIFLYIKMNKNLNYPDNKHAVPLNKIANMVKKLRK